MSIVGSAIQRARRLLVNKCPFHLASRSLHCGFDLKPSIGYECSEFGDIEVDKIFIEKFVPIFVF